MKIYGKNVAIERLNGNEKINKIYLSNKFNDSQIISLIKKKNINTKIVENKELDKMCKGLHQGIIMEVDDIKTYSLEEIIPNIDKEYPLVVILDHLEDPHNFGAIIRTANQAGAHGVIIPKRRAVGLTATVARTSAGALNYTPVAKVTNIVQTMEELKKEGLWFVCADMGGETMYRLNLKGAIGLVIGNEGDGVSKLVKENCDMIASIPMKGDIDSLNASVAAGVLAYEIVRQRM